jgi:beta-lactamase class A
MSDLQQRIQTLCEEFPGTAGVAALHLTTHEKVEVNARVSFPTASMIKIQILFELVRACARGQAQMWERVTLRQQDKTPGSGLLVDLDEGANLTLRDLAVLMMSISDNTATNMLIDRLGKQAINQACRDGGMFDTELRNKIDFDLIGKSNDNLAVGTPHDFCNFLAALRGEELLPAAYVEQMLGIMRIQMHASFLLAWELPFNPYAERSGDPAPVWVAAKSGGLSGVRCESGIIHTPAGEWVLSVMTKGFRDPRWTHDNTGSLFVSKISLEVYKAWGLTNAAA